MNDFQKAQSARILSCFNTDEGIAELTKAEILDIEKAGPGGAAFVGEIRTFGGRQYIRMPSGWKYYGKGGGAQAKAYMAEIQALKGGKKEAKPEKKMTGEEMGRKKSTSPKPTKKESASVKKTVSSLSEAASKVMTSLKKELDTSIYRIEAKVDKNGVIQVYGGSDGHHDHYHSTSSRISRGTLNRALKDAGVAEMFEINETSSNPGSEKGWSVRAYGYELTPKKGSFDQKTISAELKIAKNRSEIGRAFHRIYDKAKKDTEFSWSDPKSFERANEAAYSEIKKLVGSLSKQLDVSPSDFLNMFDDGEAVAKRMKEIISAGRAKEMSAPKEAKKPLIAMKRGDLVTILSTGQIALFDRIVREPGKEPYVLASVGRGPEIFQSGDLEEAPKGAKFGDRVDAKAPVRAPSSSAVKEVMRKYSTLDPSLRASYEKVLSSVERDGSKVYDFLKELDDRSPGRVLIEPSRNNALDVTIVSRSFWSHEDGDRGDKRAEKQFAIFDEVIKKYNMKTRIEFATAAGSSGGKKHYISLAEIKKLTNA